MLSPTLRIEGARSSIASEAATGERRIGKSTCGSNTLFIVLIFPG
jgi:hypothetical protein